MSKAIEMRDRLRVLVQDEPVAALRDALDKLNEDYINSICENGNHFVMAEMIGVIERELESRLMDAIARELESRENNVEVH